MPDTQQVSISGSPPLETVRTARTAALRRNQLEGVKPGPWDSRGIFEARLVREEQPGRAKTRAPWGDPVPTTAVRGKIQSPVL